MVQGKTFSIAETLGVLWVVVEDRGVQTGQIIRDIICHARENGFYFTGTRETLMF